MVTCGCVSTLLLLMATTVTPLSWYSLASLAMASEQQQQQHQQQQHQMAQNQTCTCLNLTGC
jgi:hypothetical protein